MENYNYDFNYKLQKYIDKKNNTQDIDKLNRYNQRINLYNSLHNNYNSLSGGAQFTDLDVIEAAKELNLPIHTSTNNNDALLKLQNSVKIPQTEIKFTDNSPNQKMIIKNNDTLPDLFKTDNTNIAYSDLLKTDDFNNNILNRQIQEIDNLKHSYNSNIVDDNMKKFNKIIESIIGKVNQLKNNLVDQKNTYQQQIVATNANISEYNKLLEHVKNIDKILKTQSPTLTNNQDFQKLLSNMNNLNQIV